MWQVLLRRSVGLQLPSKAQAVTSLPPDCLIWPRGWKGGWGAKLVSSRNSRWAASSGGSVGVYSPLGMVQMPRVFFGVKRAAGVDEEDL